MNYREAMQQINTRKALESLGQRPEQDGNYLKFQCLCGAKAVIRTYGEKKNVYFCEACKKGGNIIGFAMALKGMEYADARDFLLKAIPPAENPAALDLDYTLEYCDFLKAKGLSEELCKAFEIGKPKGRTMLSGHIVFTVRNDEGQKIAYYGINIKDGKPKFHNSFNPELVLYSPAKLDGGEVILTTSMWKCLTLLSEGKQALCNFGYPYLSPQQYTILNRFERVVLDWEFDLKDISLGVAKNLTVFHRFV